MELKIKDWTVIGTPAEIWAIIKMAETPAAEQKGGKNDQRRRK